MHRAVATNPVRVAGVNVEDATRALQVVNRFAEALTAQILERIGRDAVDVVFAGGSLATGRIAFYRSDVLEIYSDVDLYVVLRDHAHEDAGADAGLHAATAAALTAVDEVEVENGVRMMRGADVGVYSREILFSQIARPGTVDLSERHVLLHGDESIFEPLRFAIGTEIEPDEGLYLIENRISELYDRAPGGDDPGAERLARYTLLKTVADVALAWRLGTGRYENEGARPPTAGDDELVAAAVAGLDDLSGYMATPADPELACRVLGYALTVWRALAELIYPGTRGDWATMVSRRCHSGEYADNFREFLAMSSRLGRSRRRVAWSGVNLSRYSPVAAVRLSCLVDSLDGRDDIDDVARHSLNGLKGFLDQLTRRYGFVDGAYSDRVAALRKASS